MELCGIDGGTVAEHEINVEFGAKSTERGRGPEASRQVEAETVGFKLGETVDRSVQTIRHASILIPSNAR